LLRLLITIATVLVLAFAAQSALSSLFASGHRESGTFVIQALEHDVPGSPNPQSELRLQDVLVDGRLLRWRGANTYNGWEPLM
jgi:hypothetical protein